MDITPLITTANSAIEIVKLIQNTQNSLNEAEYKLKIAELLEKLSDTKIGISNLKNLLDEKNQEIHELKDKIKFNENLEFNPPFYYYNNDPIPFCPHCWENETKAIHLKPEEIKMNHYIRVCPNCKNEFISRRAEFLDTPIKKM